MDRRTPLERRTPLKQGTKGLKRTSLKRTAAPARQPEPRVISPAEQAWHAAVGGSCQHPRCEKASKARVNHHIVYRQHVEREGGDAWDLRNALTICSVCHASHHAHGRLLIPLLALPDAAYGFAVDLLGAEAAFMYLRRRYGGEDPRLGALL